MKEIGQFIAEHWRSAIEILILSIIIYKGYLYLRATRGAKVLTGLAALFITLTLLSQVLDLVVLSWLLKSLLAFVAIALVVIFQPELRRGLAELGSKKWFNFGSPQPGIEESLAECALHLANRQVGALIVVERGVDLKEYLQSGIATDAIFSTELVETILHPRTVLHDGAIVIQNGRIAAAGCLLPVSQRENLDRALGTRHRAGLGLAEETDAVVIVVSEETGAISLCHDGQIERNLSPHAFRTKLYRLLVEKSTKDSNSELEDQTSLPTGRLDDLAHHQKTRQFGRGST